MPVKKIVLAERCPGGPLSWQTAIVIREVKADVKLTLCHDQTPATGINICVYRMVCLRMNL